MKRIYIAAAYAESLVADALAKLLREQGHEVVSTWHVQRPLMPAKDPATIEAKSGIWYGNKEELRRATHLVLLVHGRPRAAYAELGYFLALAEESHDLGCVYWIERDSAEAAVPIGDERVTYCRTVPLLLESMK